jgi:fluoride ion exporter CrcB/FEX
MLESMDQLERGDFAAAFAYMSASLVLGLLMTYAGLLLGRSI